MSKVKLTKRQADVLDDAVIHYGEDLTIIRHAEKYLNLNYEEELFELTTAEVAKAIYIGYEIEPEFKVRDWVVLNGYVGVITKFSPTNNEHAYLDIFEKHTKTFMNVLTYQLRRATPKEIAKEKRRRFWHKSGREVGEFKKNDIIFNKKLGDLDEIMTGFTKVNYTDEYEIICFAHNREDIKND